MTEYRLGRTHLEQALSALGVAAGLLGTLFSCGAHDPAGTPGPPAPVTSSVAVVSTQRPESKMISAGGLAFHVVPDAAPTFLLDVGDGRDTSNAEHVATDVSSADQRPDR